MHQTLNSCAKCSFTVGAEEETVQAGVLDCHLQWTVRARGDDI